MARPITHRLYYRLTATAPHTILNPPSDQAVPRSTLAADLNAAIKRLKADYFDVARGRVDYAALRVSPAYADYRAATAALHHFDLAQLQTPAERLAFWLNLYNALIVDAVVGLGVRQTVQEIRGFFVKAAYGIGGHRFSADDIEHGILRANRGHPALVSRQFTANDPRRAYHLPQLDPRIHCALVCAATSCPPINTYTADQLDAQLDLATRNFMQGGAVVIDEARHTVTLSKIFQWYAPDWGGSWLNVLGRGDMRPVLEHLARYATTPTQQTWLSNPPANLRVRFAPYDWSLNVV